MRRFISACVCLLAFLGASEVRGSVVRRMTTSTLAAGADVIVEGEVSHVSGRWNSSRSGLETEIQVTVARTTKGPASATVTLVQPGGVLDGNRHVIAGMPTFVPGERVRLFLRRRSESFAGGAVTYRVYGWGQGKWVATQVSGRLRYAPSVGDSVSRPLAGIPDLLHFTHNGVVWPPERIPVQYLINSAGSDDMQFEPARDAIFAAFQAWQDVPCSSLSFNYAGETSLEVAVDDTNVVLWIETGWVYGEEAAGATSLWFPAGEPPTADVALNGDNFSWAVGVPSVGPATQDVIGVLTHELGHFSGLTHTMSALDTMYYSWTPWQSQRSLSADDKLGLCELYPQTGDECTTAAECEGNATCDSYARGTLCTPQADPLGAPCNYDKVECHDFCLYTKVDLSSGYCSRFCDTSVECGEGFVCQDASAGGDPVRVCFVDPTYTPPDAGPGETMCSADDACPGGWYCGDSQLCTLDCREDFDCNDAAKVCSTRGQCVAAQADGDKGGCGCASQHAPVGSGWLLFVLVFLLRRRRRAAG